MPRQALALYGVADPPAMQTSTVAFAGDGGGVVTTRSTDDGEHTRTRRVRYRFDGHVYVPSQTIHGRLELIGGPRGGYRGLPRT